MTAELIEVIRYTVFAIVIALVIGLGTVKAASITEKDYPRRSRDSAVRRGSGAQTRGTDHRSVEAPTEPSPYGGNQRIRNGAHLELSSTDVTS
jgi:hypothetical protein